MSYNILSNPDSTNPAYGLQEVIRPVIDAHAAWEFIETVSGINNRRTDVYRCLGSANDLGVDFYVGFIAGNSGTTNAYFGSILGETYDSVAKTFGKPAVYMTTTAYTPAADGSYPTARHVANETSTANATAGMLAVAGTSNMASTFNAYIPSGTSPIILSINNKRIVFSVGNTHYGYVGAYDRNYDPAVDVMPIFNGSLHALARSYYEGTHTTPATTQRGVVTRDLGGASSMPLALSCNVDSPHIGPLTGQSLTVSKDAVSNQWIASRARIQQNNRRPNLRGFLSGVVLIAMGDVSHGTGDTITIDGAEYACVFGMAAGTGNWSAWVPTAA